MNPTSSRVALCAALIAIGAAGLAAAQAVAPAPATQEITRAGAQPSAAGPAEFFTGRVRVDQTHLFGDIFARDNLDWQSRELATVGALAALSGVESQLQSHIAVSMNVGLTAAQMRQVADVLAERGQPEASRRAGAALDRHLAAAARR